MNTIYTGIAIREISLFIKNKINERISKKTSGISQIGGRILHFLKVAEDEKSEICQKDLEKIFNTSKSTMCEMLNSLEKHDYIKRVPSNSDSRKNVIILTQTGRIIDAEVDKEIKLFEKHLDDKITAEEKKKLFEIIDKLMKEDE